MEEKESMQAIAIDGSGPPRVLVAAERPRPHAYEGQVLIRIAAAGVNRPDVLQRLGLYPPPEGVTDIPGLEVSGTIEAVGRNVSRWKVGEQVVALVAGGGYAEYVAADAGSVLPLPAGLSLEEGAALPETVFTVWHNVFQRGGLLEGETFLVHGGTSGIGTVAVQLAKAHGARTFATAGSDKKCDILRSMGVARAINYNREDFVSAVRDATDGHGVDLILDMVGGDYIERNYEAAAMDGRIVQIAFLNGASATVNFSKLMMKRLTHTGSTLRARSASFKAGLAEDIEKRVWPLVPDALRPIMDSTFPLVEAAAAHQRMEAGDHVGKIVLVTQTRRQG